MNELFEKMAINDWLKMNAQLQQKKSALRAELATIGVLKKKGKNDYDKYTYFSEAQYKELFTGLLPKHKLELSFTTNEYDSFEATGKNCNGRLTKMCFVLTDIETGFYESTDITGEGADKGDKGGYKAYTGALKYYLADTFMVATGDDAEAESPQERMTQKSDPVIKPNQVQTLQNAASEVGITAEQICSTFRVDAIAKLTQSQWRHALQMLEQEKAKKGA